MMKKWQVVLLSLIVTVGVSVVAMDKVVLSGSCDRQALKSSAELKTQVIAAIAVNRLNSSTERLEQATLRDYGIPSSQGNSPEIWMQYSSGSFHDAFYGHFNDCP